MLRPKIYTGTHLAMSFVATTRSIGAGIGIAALITFANPVHAQTEPSNSASAQVVNPAKTESSATLDTARPDLPSKDELTAPSTATIEAFIARLDGASRAIHENSKKDPALVREGCRALLTEILDLPAMARATNSEIWEQMTPAQREVLGAAFEHRMVSRCVRQFAQYGGETMSLAGVKSISGGDMLATIRLGQRDDAKLVTWRLQNSGADTLRAVDVITEGRSAVSDARNEFAAVLQSVNGDIEALIAFMQK